MRTRFTTTALAAGLLLAQAALAAPPRASFVEIALPSGAIGMAYALNDAGVVVGNVQSAALGQRGFSWSVATGLVLHEGFANFVDINNGGEMLGSRGLSDVAVLMPGGSVRSLSMAGSSYTSVHGINEAGTVVGQALLSGSGNTAIRWDAAGNPTVIRANAFPAAINARGTVVGSSTSDSRAWRSLAGGAATSLSAPAEAVSSVASGLNAHDESVGYVFTATGAVLGTLWRADGSLAWMHGMQSGEAINDARQVVGVGFAVGPALWREGTGTTALAGLMPMAYANAHALDINEHAQITGYNRVDGIPGKPYLLTLHPDWSGGDGAWSDTAGQHWNWAGTGTAAARVGAMHDVVIDPGRSATISGAAEGRARSLQLGGTVGSVVTLNLSGGTTTLGDGDAAIAYPSAVRRGGVLAGGGRLVVNESLDVMPGGRVEVGLGEAMQISADNLNNRGRIQVIGHELAVARLETSGHRYHFTNNTEGLVLVQDGELVLSGGLQNFGRVSLQRGRLLAADTVLNHAGAQMGVSFGESVIDAVIDNRGLLVVSNGAELSFHGQLELTGELRVSAGGRANLFGDVHFAASGSMTGDGEIRFEGGLSVDGGPTLSDWWALDMEPHTTLAGSSLTLLGNADDLVQGDRVDLFDWLGGVSGSFATLTLPTLADGLVWDSSDLYLGGTLGVAAVPEPASWLLAALGLPVLLGWRRRASGHQV